MRNSRGRISTSGLATAAAAPGLCQPAVDAGAGAAEAGAASSAGGGAATAGRAEFTISTRVTTTNGEPWANRSRTFQLAASCARYDST